MLPVLCLISTNNSQRAKYKVTQTMQQRSAIIIIITTVSDVK